MNLNTFLQVALKSGVSAVLLCASAFGSVPASEHKAAIKAEMQRFADAWNRNDLRTIKELYTEDAKLMPDGAQTVAGREAVMETLQKLRSANWPDTITFLNVEVYGSGESVTACSDMEFHDKSGVLKGRGKQMLIFVKQGGQWKLFRDTYNDNGPVNP